MSVTTNQKATAEVVIHDCDGPSVSRALRQSGYNDWAQEFAEGCYRIDDGDPDSGHQGTIAVKTLADAARIWNLLHGMGPGRPQCIYLQIVVGDPNEAVYSSAMLGWMVEGHECSGYIRIKPEMLQSSLRTACEKAKDVLDAALNLRPEKETP